MISGLKLMAPTLIVPSSSSIGMAVTSCPTSLWLEEFLEPRDPFEIFEWLDPMPPDIIPLLLNRLEAWMPFWLYFKLRRINSSSSYQRLLLDESEKQINNNATYVSVNCYQSKSYNDHQNNDSFQFFVFPCLNIIWKWNWDHQSNYSKGHSKNLMSLILHWVFLQTYLSS